MGRKNPWDGYAPPFGWEASAIERERFNVLESCGKPLALQNCTDTHGCRQCLGWTTRRGERCEACHGTGVGPIHGRDFCPHCNRSSPDVESDPRLIIRPGQLPKAEPKLPAGPLLRPKLSKEEARELAKAERAEAKAKKVAAKAKEKQKAKEQAMKAKLKEKEAAKAKADREKQKKAAARAAEKARPKYIPPWKQVPPS